MVDRCVICVNIDMQRHTGGIMMLGHGAMYHQHDRS